MPRPSMIRAFWFLVHKVVDDFVDGQIVKIQFTAPTADSIVVALAAHAEFVFVG